MKKQFLEEVKYVRKLFENSYESAGGAEFRYFHSLNVVKIALDLAKSLRLKNSQRKVILLAGLFHDAAKHTRVDEKGFLDGSHQFELQNGLPRHEDESAELAANFMFGRLSNADLMLMKETIVGHDQPETILQKVLYDADELSELGAMNLWKMFTYSSYKKRNIKNTVMYWFEIDRKRHLEKAKNLHFKQSKIVGKEKIRLCDLVMRDLLKQIKTTF